MNYGHQEFQKSWLFSSKFHNDFYINICNTLAMCSNFT